jgi:hypothetical protein
VEGGKVDPAETKTLRKRLSQRLRAADVEEAVRLVQLAVLELKARK